MQLVKDIWASYRRLPRWVQIWIAFILVPINILPIIEILNPGGVMIAALSIGGMAPNLYFMIRERGFSRIMCLSHLILWIPLCLILIRRADQMPQSMTVILWAVLIVDVISLGFDIPDLIKWLRGNRAIA